MLGSIKRKARHHIFLVVVMLITALIAACSNSAAPPAGGSGGSSTPPPADEPANRQEAPVKKDSEAEIAEYFKGKTIKILVGYNPGGGFDLYSRIYAEHLRKYIPGEPNIVVENKPGGGSILALQTAMRSDPDGLTMIVFPSALVTRSMLGENIEGFKWDQPMYLGAPDFVSNYQALYVRSDVANSWEEVEKLGRPLIHGETEKGQTVGIGVTWAELVGAPIKTTYGYSGSTDLMAAIERKELESITRGSEKLVEPNFPEWIENKSITPVFWWLAPIPEDFLQKMGWEQPPHVFDVIQGTEIQKEALEKTLEVTKASKIIALPDGVPEYIYQTLYKASEQTIKDQAFIDAMNERNYDVGYVSGEDLVKLFGTAVEGSEEVKGIMRTLLGMN